MCLHDGRCRLIVFSSRNLVDSSGAGKLAQNQFSVAMYLITRLRQGVISTVPTSIPPQLWNSIAVANPAPATPGASSITISPPVSPNIAAAAPLTTQATILRDMNLPKPPGSPASRRMSTRPFASPTAGAGAGALSPGLMVVTGGAGEWGVKEEEKGQYDKYFEGIDVTKKGHVTGK